MIDIEGLRIDIATRSQGEFDLCTKFCSRIEKIVSTKFGSSSSTTADEGWDSDKTI